MSAVILEHSTVVAASRTKKSTKKFFRRKTRDERETRNDEKVLGGNEIIVGNMGARGIPLSVFWTLEKYAKNDWSWPISRTDYWNLHVGTSHDVELLFPFRVEFPLSRRFIIISDKKAQFKAMTAKLNQVYSEIQAIPVAIADQQSLKEGVMVVVWSPAQKSFIRAQVLSKEGQSNFRLYAFDLGETIEVNGNEIYPMCTAFLKLMPMALVMYLDGLERFDRLGLLKSIMKSKIELNSGPMWSMEVTRVGQEKLYCKLRPVGGVGGSFASLNHILLKELWTRSPEPQLPATDCSRLYGFIVNIQCEGKVCIQFDSPYAAAFQDFVLAAKKTLDNLILDEEAFADKRATLPLDPNEIYMAPYGQSFDFFRAKYIPDQKTPPGKVRLKFIDYGNEEIEGIERILVAREINCYLSIAPPQCIEAQLVNVLTVNVNGAQEILDDNTAVIIRKVDPGDESRLPQVQVLVPQFDERTKFVEQACFSTLLEQRGLAEATKVPHPRTHSRIQEEFAPLEYIEMVNSTTWSLDAPSNMTTVVAPTILNLDQVIFFRIDYIPDCASFAKTFTDDSLKQRHRRDAVEFTIQPVGAREVLREMSRLILAHVKEPWYKRMKKSFNYNAIDKGGYYAYYCNERSRFYRAKLDSATGIRDKQARVLLIDFAKYLEDFDVTELEISIPLKVCGMGPQAASVHHVTIRDNSYFSPDDPGFQTANSDPVGWREKICAFKRFYQANDKICTAKIVGISHDKNGVTSLALDDLKVVNSN